MIAALLRHIGEGLASVRAGFKNWSKRCHLKSAFYAALFIGTFTYVIWEKLLLAAKLALEGAILAVAFTTIAILLAFILECVHLFENSKKMLFFIGESARTLEEACERASQKLTVWIDRIFRE